MRICTIFTGGTIGSVLNETGYIGPGKGTSFRVLEKYRKEYNEDVEFEVIEPYRILSENLDADNLLKLFETVRRVVDNPETDGIIITHGTDTLQYGACMLGYVFGSAKIPIVLVSSNYVLDDIRANGMTNFRYAVEFIKGRYGNGVFVSYCNKGENPKIHRATRLQPLIPYSDYVASVQDSWYGHFEKEKFIPNPEYHVTEGKAAIPEENTGIHLTEDAGQIVWIHPSVGMRYPKLTPDVKVVLHGSYHSGTICVKDTLQSFVREALQLEIPIYLTGLLTGANAYETVRVYEEMGIKPLHTGSEVAQYCKLWLALSNNLNISSVMEESVAEDWI